MSGKTSMVTTVGLGSHASTSLTKILAPRDLFERLKKVVLSQQNQDRVKDFAIGATVSASKLIADALLSAVKRLVLVNATFLGRDEAFRWVLFFMATHPNFRGSHRAVQITARTSLLTDIRADYLGLIDERESRALQIDAQGKKTDEMVILQRQRQQQQNEELASLGVHILPLPGDQLHFVFEGTHFWMRRDRRPVGHAHLDETISLTILSLSTSPLRRFLKVARGNYMEQARGRVAVYRLSPRGGWQKSSGIPKRSPDSVHLPGKVKEDLLNDAKRFSSLQTRRWYADRGVPYRRGYLLYGPPGTGKSSLCHVLASVMEQPIYVLNLSSGAINDAEFLRRMNEIPSQSIALIEDVDAAFIDRKASGNPHGQSSKVISFSALLNAIDGVDASEGRLLCITTNHIDKLDAALIRPGRIDRKFAFHNATKKQARDLFLRWYMPRGGFSKDLHSQADEFAAAIPKHTISVAAIQGFLLSCGTDVNAAIENVPAWVQEQG